MLRLCAPRGRMLILAAAIGLPGLVVGCGGGGSSSSGTPSTGVQIRMIDAPGPFQHVYVTLGSVSVVDSNGGVTVINSQTQPDIDLLALRTVDRIIGTADLPPGQYSQIRLIVNSATVVDSTGASFPVRVPSGAQTGIKLVDNFTITANQLTSITIDFDAAQSIVSTGNSHRSRLPA